jgi:hypothetical protein
MECKDAWTGLDDMMNMKDVRISSSDFHELKTLQLIVPVEESERYTGRDADLDSLRAQLAKMSAEKESLESKLLAKESSSLKSTPRKLYKKDSDYREMKDQLDDLEKEEKELRTQFVDLTQSLTERHVYSRVSGELMHVTYKGRELLSELEQRMVRVSEMQLKAFIAELDAIKAHFQESSSKARMILKKISPRLSKIEEIHLRSVAVGLSGRAGEYREASELFVSAYKTISDAVKWDNPVCITLAESLSVIAREKSDLKRLVGKAIELMSDSWREDYAKEDQARAVAIIMSCRGDTEDFVEHTKRISERFCPKWPSVAALLATQYGGQTGRVRSFADWTGAIEEGGGIFGRFVHLRDGVAQMRSDELESNMASALMASADIPLEVIIERFQKARFMLKKFNAGSMYVPSAMMAILPTSVDEAMDNLRLASASIGANRLSLGGIENLSLGMKLLMHTAAMPGGVGAGPAGPPSRISVTTRTVPPVLTIAGISIASALALSTGILAFHQFSLHKTAVRDYAFHPVHSHFVYG